MFQRVVDLEMKSLAGLEETIRINSFLKDLLYRLYSVIGVWSLRILNVSMNVK